MKQSIFQAILSACFLFACSSLASAQTEIGLRPLFYQNDFVDPKGNGDVSQGQHAGEWQLGISARNCFSRHFAARLEANHTRGRYTFSNIRFAYLNFCLIPEWRISPTVYFGAGGFVNATLKDPLDTQQKGETGLLANLGFRHGKFEIQCRYQRWIGSSGKFTLGAGLDYFFSLKKKTKKEGLKL